MLQPDVHRGRLRRSRSLQTLDRASLLAQAVAFLAGKDDEARVREHVGRALDLASDADVTRFVERLLGTGATWGYHPPDPLARSINHAMAVVTLEPGSSLLGGDVLGAARRSLVFVANHLSFADANLLEALLFQAGHEAIAARLTVLVGPKVYSEAYRRLASLCFGTIKTPQSTSRASGEAVMPRREVAKLAADTLRTVAERHAAGDHLLVFVEGTRSRDAQMQRALPAVSRYLSGAETLVVPVAIRGSEQLVPVGEERIHRARVSVRLGRPFGGADLLRACRGKRALAMDAVGLAIARALPSAYRGAYADDAPGLDEARSVVKSLAAPP